VWCLWWVPNKWCVHRSCAMMGSSILCASSSIASSSPVHRDGFIDGLPWKPENRWELQKKIWTVLSSSTVYL
jgi:hypothetical protein